MSARSMRESLVVHLLIHGNAYLYIQRDGYGDPVAFHLLDPRIVFCYYQADGSLIYSAYGQLIDPSDIVHVAAPGIDGITGLPPLHHLRDVAGIQMALDSFSGSFFRNGCNNKGILTVEGDFDDMAQANLRRGFEALHAGANNGNTMMVLPEGYTFTPTSVPPNEAQFLETQRLQILKVAIAFNLPPTKLMLYDKMSLNTLEESNLDFFNTSLLPWVDRIQQAFNRKLFTRQERSFNAIEHDDSASLKGRQGDQVAVWKNLKDMGVINTNEVRAKLGLPPIENGDVYMVASNNFQPLDRVVEGEDLSQI